MASTGRLCFELLLGGTSQRVIQQVLDCATSREEALKGILQTELYTHYVPESVVDKSIDWHVQTFADILDGHALPSHVQESSLFPKSQIRQRRGRQLSADFFRHLYAAHLASQLVSTKKRPRMLELGAGCGKVGLLCKRLFGLSTYFICDIPETLVFARLYLSSEQPEANTLWVDNVGELQRPDIDSFDYVFVPVMFAQSLSAGFFDLFMNFHSLGEFDNTSIRFWMRWLQATWRPSHILVCNRYLNLVEAGTHDWRLRENEASVSFDHRWQPIIWELEPRYLRCPYVQTMQSRYLLFAARDGSAQPPEVRASASEQAMSYVREINVWRALTDGPPTSFRRAMLAHDLSMSGPLFQLWNAVRLKESVDSLLFLLRYLDATLPRSKWFVEERPYYVTRLRSLLSETPPDENIEARRWLAENDSLIQAQASEI